MKDYREDLTYLKTQLIRHIIGLVGSVVLFFVGLAKNNDKAVTISVVLAVFIAFLLVKTVLTIKKINK